MTYLSTLHHQHLRKQSGLTAITSLLIISTVAIGIAISVSLLGITEAQNALSFHQGMRAGYSATSCVEEALLRLRDDVQYSGGSLQVGDASCTIQVSGTGSNRTIVAEGEITGPPSFVKEITVAVKRTGGSITILDWEEQ
jgi:hypothetical protein